MELRTSYLSHLQRKGSAKKLEQERKQYWQQHRPHHLQKCWSWVLAQLRDVAVPCEGLEGIRRVQPVCKLPHLPLTTEGRSQHCQMHRLEKRRHTCHLISTVVLSQPHAFLTRQWNQCRRLVQALHQGHGGRDCMETARSSPCRRSDERTLAGTGPRPFV